MDDHELAAGVDEIAADVGFSGVVRIDLEGRAAVERAYGFADRGRRIANTADTRFAIASGSKTFTALAVMALVDDGVVELATTARSLLGDDLPLIDDRVTIEQLLAHRSGIGDYLDEDEVVDMTDHVLTVPVHTLVETDDFLTVLDGHPMKSEPDARFTYCNGGYIVLALLAERAAGVPFHDLVDERVFRPAGLIDTAYRRTDETHDRMAFGYLHPEGLQTNVLHLPVRPNGDGGASTTTTDVHRFWDALFDGRIVSSASVEAMVEPRSPAADVGMSYGLGCWIDDITGAVTMIGGDAGVGCFSSRDRSSGTTITVLGNQTRGTWPTGRRVTELIAGTHDQG